MNPHWIFSSWLTAWIYTLLERNTWNINQRVFEIWNWDWNFKICKMYILRPRRARFHGTLPLINYGILGNSQPFCTCELHDGIRECNVFKAFFQNDRISSPNINNRQKCNVPGWSRGLQPGPWPPLSSPEPPPQSYGSPWNIFKEH